jgi:hypothetical protein
MGRQSRTIPRLRVPVRGGVINPKLEFQGGLSRAKRGRLGEVVKKLEGHSLK